jgi:LmbE family N-acetylglucosaminyl deacetylase
MMRNRAAVIAAHADDEVLGCGGTIAKLADAGVEVHVMLLADGETSRSDLGKDSIRRSVDMRNSAADRAMKILGASSIVVHELPDNRLDSCILLDVVKLIEAFLQEHRPYTLFTHHNGDVNIDHRVVHDAVIAACRPVPDHFVRELLFFEVLSSTEWRPPSSALPFNPNWFVDITVTLERKLEALRAYESEMRDFPHPRSYEGAKALAAYRGVSVGVAAAEAFVLGRKLA